jgi:HSP20 family protein
MVEIATKLPATPEQKANRPAEWRPFEGLRREVDRLFEDFQLGAWRSPFGRGAFDVQPFWRSDLWSRAPAVDIIDPAVDIVDKENVYELSAELPGMDENNIDVKFSNGALTIKGEKRDEREEKKKNFYLAERRYGSFQRSFSVPEGVDAERIEASFKKGVLTVTLPKTPQARKNEKKIPVKQA